MTGIPITAAAGLSLLDWLLLWGAWLLLLGALGHHHGAEGVGRASTVLGFGVLGLMLARLAVGYLLGGRSDWLFLTLVTAAGSVLCLQAMRLALRRWSRTQQLATTAAVMLVVVVPFELYPYLHVAVQEALTTQVAAVVDTLGAQPTVERTAGGELTRLSFEGGGHYQVTRECTGIDAVALFGAILVGARTTVRRKVAGLAFVLAAVYAVNVVRLVFVALAMSGNWFGGLLGGESSVRTTYYVAEVGIGQPFVVVASVVGYLWVSRWIPDIVNFAAELLSIDDRRTLA